MKAGHRSMVTNIYCLLTFVTNLRNIVQMLALYAERVADSSKHNFAGLCGDDRVCVH